MAEITKTAKGKGKWAELKKIRLPRKPKGEKNFEFVGVNGKAYQVPCGKEVEVPLPIYEVLLRQQAYRDILMDVKEDIPNKA